MPRVLLVLLASAVPEVRPLVPVVLAPSAGPARPAELFELRGPPSPWVGVGRGGS